MRQPAVAHKQLDDAVLEAYARPHDLAYNDILERLLALNLEANASEGRDTG